MYAAKNGHIDIIKYLHNVGANLFATNRSGLTAAHVATHGDHTSVLQILIDLFTSDVEYIIQNKTSIQEQQTNAFKAIVSNKSSSKEFQSIYGSILADFIIDDKYHDFSMTDVLLMLTTAVVDQPSNNGCRPLHVAASIDARNTVLFLLQLKIAPNEVDSIGESALHKAGRANHYVVYRLLVEHGGDQFRLNSMRETPAQLLRDDGHVY
jgi:ankyrin repeat protein